MLFAAPPDLKNFTPTYKCGAPGAPAVCYGTNEKTHLVFMQVQTEANRFSTANRSAVTAGFAPLQVDGKIGGGTVNALQLIAQKAMTDPTAAGLGIALAPLVTSKETVAQNAPLIVSQLGQLSQRFALPSVPPPPPPIANLPATQHQIMPQTMPSTLPPPPGGFNWKPWAIAGGVVAVLGGAWYFYFRK